MPKASDVGELSQPAALIAFTVILPVDCVVVAKIEFEVDVPDQPFGKVHIYDVAPETEATEYVSVAPSNGVVFPVIALLMVNEPGAALITSVAAKPIQPSGLVTVTVCEPTANPLKTGLD